MTPLLFVDDSDRVIDVVSAESAWPQATYHQWLQCHGQRLANVNHTTVRALITGALFTFLPH